ncbi:hypothetical protein L195_g033351, partial [Trifolium pratense]
MIDEVVEVVGEENVVQVVTNNVANYKVVDFEKKIHIHQETIPKECSQMTNGRKTNKFARSRDGKLVEDVVLVKDFWKGLSIAFYMIESEADLSNARVGFLNVGFSNAFKTL